MRSSTWTSSRFPISLSLVLAGCGGCDETHTDAGSVLADVRAEAAVASTSALAKPDVNVAASFDDFPDAGPADLDLRGKHLLEAISQNDAALAADIVLPREAWISARDAQDPASLYDVKFKSLFAAQIARANRHEKGMDRAVFVSFELGQNPSRAQPHKHEWKEPLWRVGHSTLTFTIDGRVHRIEIAEMIAWRGNWYVARLHER
jgi:hypothetical protein